MTDDYLGWKDWQATDFGRFGPEEALYFAAELRAIGITSVRGLTIGEVGYGNGAFAGWVQQAGGHWLGREVVAGLQDRAKLAGFEVIPSDARFSTAYGAGRFDVIVAFDVIEHLELEQIRSLLRDGRLSLKPGGLLLIRCPSGDSPFSGATYCGDLTHRTLLGSSAVRQLAMEADLTACQVRKPVLPVWGLGPTRAARRMTLLLMRTVFFSFIQRVFMDNCDAVLSPNMIVVFRKEENGSKREC